MNHPNSRPPAIEAARQSAIRHREAYRAELKQHVDNPYARALVESGYLDTSELQALIQRRGLTDYEGHLATLRAHRAGLEQQARGISQAQTLTAIEVTRLEKAWCASIENPPHYRDHTGRLVPNLAAQERARAALASARNRLDELTRQLPAIEEQARNHAWLAARLADAVVACLVREESKPAITPPAPVVNIINEVKLPDELRITAMPKRETISKISRDGAGNITASTQTEQDA